MDAKSLLRAKKATARVEHPYASYNAAGVLRCSICAVPGEYALLLPSTVWAWFNARLRKPSTPYNMS